MLQIGLYVRRARSRFQASGPGGTTIRPCVHLRLVGKHVVDFQLVLNELFARCYR